MAAVTFKTGIIISADASGALKAMGLTESQLKRLNMSMGRSTGLAAKQGAAMGKLRGQVINLARSFGLLAGGTVIGSAFVTLGRTVARYGDTLKQVEAITSRGMKQNTTQIALFKELEKETKRLGATTRFSATQAAEGAKFLARAGFTTGEVMESLESTLRLAQAGALGLGRAADIASNVMKGFQLESSEMTRIVNVLAVATASTNTSVEQLGVAMSFVAPASASLKISLEETTAAIGALSDAGIQGERAGTGLRQILIKLGQAGENITGGFEEGLLPVLLKLKERNIDLQAATELVGVRQASALLVLVDSTNKLNDLTKAYTDAIDPAAEMARIMDESLLGALYRVRSAWEAMQLSFASQGAESSSITFLNKLAEVMRYTANNVEILEAALGALAVFLGTKFALIVGTGLLGSLGGDVLGLKGAERTWRGAIRSIFKLIPTLAAAGTAWFLYKDASEQGISSLEAAITPIEELTEAFGTLHAVEKLAEVDARKQLNITRLEAIKALLEEISALEKERISLGSRDEWGSGDDQEARAYTIDKRRSEATEEIRELRGEIEKTATEAQKLNDAIRAGADTLGKKVADWTPAQKDIIEGIKEWGKETKTAQQIYDQAMKDLALTSETTKLAVRDAFRDNPELLKAWEEQLKKTFRANDEGWIKFNDQLEEAKSRLKELRSAQQVYNDTLAELKILRDGKEGEGITDLEFYTLAADAADKLKEANIRAAEESENVWVKFGLELSDTFRDSFIKAEGHLDSFIDRVKKTLKEQFLRTIFDATIGNFFKNLAVGINQSSGGSNYSGLLGGITSVLRGTGLGATGQGAQPGGVNARGEWVPQGAGDFGGTAGGGGGDELLTAGNAAKLYQFFSGAAGSGAATLAGVGGALQYGTQEFANLLYSWGFQDTGSALFRSATSGNLSNAYTNAGWNIVGGVAGAYAGNQIGESLLGKEAESSWGATIGGILGAALTSWSGGWGAAIGSAIGSIVDVAFGGDGRRRSNTGFLVGSRVGSSAQDAAFTETAASGLRIQAFEKRGDYNAAIALRDAALEIDEVLTDAARTFGLTVDFSNTTLRGVHGDAGHTLAPGQIGGFFGAVGFNGEGTLEGALDLFTKEWIAELSDQLPALTRPLINSLVGTAEELTNGFVAALSIGKLLELDVVRETEQALKDLEVEQLSLIETYDKMVEAVQDAIAGLDGSAASMGALNDVLREQKIATAQLVAAYREVGINVDSVLGDTIDRIRESTLDTEQLYGLRRDQISDLFQELQVATSPEEIADLVASIDALSNEAFNLLDDSQQATLADEFIGFLTNAADTASNIISDQIAALGETEQSIERDFTVKLDTNEFAAAVTEFRTAINDFTQGAQPGAPDIYGAYSPNHPRFTGVEVNV